ncbi:NAD-dependent epimerase/dehydratase family protein [Anaeromyxobacter paludicola]|uniref:Epimerase n=1 Tax=Anaeromyxobacter paludicola TaxID=2918171 RepID=A0ABN6N356_9BACT|nr:NAD-dependent epimerase/dehydratase family protein [Anaeromyxobacter paludicola]BDG06970.1 epimerase [Anaeromyxobacter paludicola]
MRALVTGAGGFLGQHLARALVASGHEVRAMVRPGGSRGELGGGVEVVAGDATRPDDLARAVRGCPLVFHLAGVRRAAVREEFLRVNAEGTRLALEACLAEGAAAQRFVLAGSLAAAGPSREGKREEDPLQPAEWYGESKAEAERIALSYAGRLPVAVARPPRIIGPGDRENLLFFRIVARGLLLELSGPPRPLSWIDVRDCARGFLALAERPEAPGRAFFLASAERTDLSGLQQAVAEALGIRPRRVRLPAGALRAAALVADLLTRATGRRLPLNRKLARQLLAPGWTCEVSRARDLLGFEARIPLADSVRDSCEAYRAAGWV